MRFSGHETFACRYAWLPKAYRAISESQTAFSDEEWAMVRLGVGKNMVRSIRFWVEAMGVAATAPDRTLRPTIFGQRIFGEGGFDPFLEDTKTLWLLHWNVSTRFSDPLFAWDFLINRWPYAELTRSEALSAFTRECHRLNASLSEVTLAQHLDVFLHTYVSRHAMKGASEDSLDSPLAALNLVQVAGERGLDGSLRREPVYAFRREAKPEVSRHLFEYCLDDYWQKRHVWEATITYRDVAIAPGSIGQVFKLPENDIRTRLDAYTLNSTQRLFSYQPSAVQGTVSRRNTEPVDYLARIYLEEGVNG
jgi:Protein of unknown function (DUF4007)